MIADTILILEDKTGGDCDTNAAIVGGIVALAVGAEGIPQQWLAMREKTPFS